MAWGQKVQHTYQFSIKEQFADTTTTCQDIVAFKQDQREHHMALAPTLTAMEVHCVQFMEALLDTCAMYSMPQALFSKCEADHGAMLVQAMGGDLTHMVQSLRCDQGDLHASFDNLVFFQVVTVSPGKMVRQLPTHLALARSTVRTCTFEALKSRDGHASVRPMAAGLLEVDVLPWCTPGLFGAVSAERVA